MKSNPEIQTIHWPYGIEIEVVKDGILLRPKRKAREGWAESIAKVDGPDDLSEFRTVTSEFDEKEWEW